MHKRYNTFIHIPLAYKETRMLKSLLVILLLAIMPPGTMSGERQGPHFILEPPPRIEFANSTGAQIECAAHASPKPKIEWLKNDGSRVEKIAGLREVDLNGTLYFPPFSGELYRQDVHDTIYQCRVSNTLGSILSRMVRVRAVVNQKYEVQMYDEYVIEGNTAVFRFQVPIYASEFIIVTSWVEGGLHNLYPNTDTDEFQQSTLILSNS
ncbi:cell adhesion molecule Dscam1-like [Halyomorpha halys]|uniref:cell adhesion molecule Dscam1-like n=1 Tax=Halyomorpha halys TaxID=286706 RepID=UPI0034D354FA